MFSRFDIMPVCVGQLDGWSKSLRFALCIAFIVR